MKQNEANMWDKQMSLAQVFGQMVAGSFFAAPCHWNSNCVHHCSFTLLEHFYQLSQSKQRIQLRTLLPNWPIKIF